MNGMGNIKPVQWDVLTQNGNKKVMFNVVTLALKLHTVVVFTI